MAMIVRKGPKSSKAGVDTRPNEREPKRVAPRQRMPKELESMQLKRLMPKEMPSKRGVNMKPKKPKRKP